MPRWVRLVALWIAASLMLSAAPARVALRVNDVGDAVQMLQQRLIDTGYLHSRADGKFGAKTERAIGQFQRQYGFAVDGVASAEVLDALYGDIQAIVYIAPTGKRYHVRENCRGLSNAKSVSSYGYLEVKATRTPCIFCYGRLALHLALQARNNK